MIRGTMNGDLFPVISPTVRGTGRRRREVVEATLDTGFNGYIVLSKSTVAYLKLERIVGFSTGTTLADGSDFAAQYYVAKVEWDGETVTVPAIATDGGCLVGTEMMRGYDLHVSVEEDGAVTLTKKGEAASGS